MKWFNRIKLKVILKRIVFPKDRGTIFVGVLLGGVIIFTEILTIKHDIYRRCLNSVKYGKIYIDPTVPHITFLIKFGLGHKGIKEIGYLLLYSPDEGVRERAVEVLYFSKTEESIPYLFYASLMDPSIRVRWQSLECLQKISEDFAIPVINIYIYGDNKTNCEVMRNLVEQRTEKNLIKKASTIHISKLKWKSKFNAQKYLEQHQKQKGNK